MCSYECYSEFTKLTYKSFSFCSLSRDIFKCDMQASVLLMSFKSRFPLQQFEILSIFFP